MKKNSVKKGIRYLFILLLTLASLVIILPLAIPIKDISSRQVEEFSKKAGIELKINEMGWRWFPFPHLELSDIRISKQKFDLHVPSARLYPHLMSLLDGRINLELSLDAPVFSLEDLAQKEEALKKQSPDFFKETLAGIKDKIPVSAITLKDGTININKEKILPFLQEEELILTKVDARLNLVKDGIKGDVKCKSFFSKDFFFRGYLNLNDLSYSLKLAVSGLKPHLLLSKDLTKRFIAPVESEANFKIDAQGKGVSSLRAAIRGDFPCYIIEPQKKESLFSCGHADLLLVKKAGELELKIKELVFTDPKIKLIGQVRKERHEDSKAGFWDINIAAKDVDLTAVRKKLLFILGKEKVVQEVCSIVKAGKAEHGSFSFKGPAEDFKKLESMTITATAKDADIHVPDLDFELTKASGPIIIKDAVLYGEGLSAKMGKSIGSNGLLAYGLLKSRDVLKLEMDVKADVSELPQVLKQTVENRLFRKELEKFSHIQGNGTAHLKFGDTKEKIKYDIMIDSMQGSLKYERLSGKVGIKKGQLRITNDFVSWKEVEGVIEKNTFGDAAGTVTLSKDPGFHITSLKGSLEAYDLLKELFKYSVIEKRLSKALSSVKGPIKIHDFSLEGPILKPKKWKYALSASSENLNFESPLLPGQVGVDEAEIIADQTKISIKNCKAKLKKSKEKLININGELLNDHLRDFRGWLVFDGPVDEAMGAWVEEKGWIPPQYFPKIPCRLKDLKVSWDQDISNGETLLSGRILPHKNDAGENIWAELDLKNNDDDLFIKKFLIKNGKKEFNLSFSTKKQPKGKKSPEKGDVNQKKINKTIFVSLKGDLSGKTLDLFLRENSLLKGEISGDFTLHASKEDISSSAFKGNLRASSIYWPWGLEKPILLKDVKLQAQGKKINFKTFNIQLDGHLLTSDGHIFVDKSGLNLAFDAHAAELSLMAVNNLVQDQQNSENDFCPINGRLNIYVDKFTYKSRLVEAFNFTWQPLVAQLDIADSKDIVLGIKQALLCNLHTSGSFKPSRDGSGKMDGDLYVKTEKEEKPLFEKALPCLGLDEELIQGEFEVDAALHGIPGNWHDGTIKIKAKEGRIFKMVLMAKIFSLINVLDIFSGGLPDLFKEGYSYSVLDSDSEIKDNILKIKKLIIKGRGMNIFASGTVNLNNNQTDLIFLVAPFKTLDKIISMVPLVGKAVEAQRGAIITVPVGVKGDFDDPKIIILPPSAVGEEILRLVTDTIKLPFTIFESIIPKGKKNDSKDRLPEENKK